MSWFGDVAAHKDALLRGLTLLVGGAALVLAGSMVGNLEGKGGAIGAGIIASTGIVVMFLGFFVYVLPPLLPSK